MLKERLPSGDKVTHENHNEKKMNMNYYFRDSSEGFKNHHISKIDMRKFDGKDPVTWILHMEKYFDLHDVQQTQNIHIAYLYLEPKQFVWYRWLCSSKALVTWPNFIEECWLRGPDPSLDLAVPTNKTLHYWPF